MNASEIAHKAGDLVGGDRQKQHGAKEECFGRMANLLNAYLASRRTPGSSLDGTDCAHIMVLFKLARTQTGSFNPDDWIDICGYGACAGELAHSASVGTTQ